MGLDFELAQKTLDLYKSESLQQTKQRVGDAKGFTNAVIASIVNPTATVDTLLQSAPTMLASIAAARYFAMELLRKAGLTAGSAEAAAFLKQPSVISKLTLAGSATEGAQVAGSIQEKGRAAGRDYLQTAPSALGAGATTAALGFLTSKIPGLKDAEASAATAGLGAAQRTSLPAAAKEIGKATVKESLEEGSQSGSEQAFSNLSLGKPMGKGVPEAAGQGAVVGAATGAGLRTFSSVANAIQADKNNPANILAGEMNRRVDAIPSGRPSVKEAKAILEKVYGSPVSSADIAEYLSGFEVSPANLNPNLKDAGRILPANSDGRVEPAGEVDISQAPGRTEPVMTTDDLSKIVAPDTNEPMISLDDFAVPPTDSVTPVTSETPAPAVTPVTPKAPTVTPVTPETPASYAADLAAGKKKNTPADVEFFFNRLVIRRHRGSVNFFPR